MQISLILAMAKNRVIGNKNQLPWHLPADLKYFKATTLGKPIIMGRKTYDSIGKPLPGRTNIILTQDPHFHAEGCSVVHTVDAALKAAGDVAEVMVIGGATLYKQFLPFAHRIYLTLIHQNFAGDTYFPELPTNDWQVHACQDFEPDEKNAYRYSFLVLEKNINDR